MFNLFLLKTKLRFFVNVEIISELRRTKRTWPSTIKNQQNQQKNFLFNFGLLKTSDTFVQMDNRTKHTDNLLTVYIYDFI